MKPPAPPAPKAAPTNVPPPPKPAASAAPPKAAAPAKIELPPAPDGPKPQAIKSGAAKPEAKTSAIAFRIWTDGTGAHRVLARLASVLPGGMVRLQRADGVYVRVAFERLSPADQRYLSARGEDLAAR